MPDIETKYTAEDFLQQVTTVAGAVGFQSSEPGTEIAGMIVSFLAIHPEKIASFMEKGSGALVDGDVDLRKGCLSYRAINGNIRHWGHSDA